MTTPDGSPLTRTKALEDHLGYLDGLRAVAALFVVFHHMVFQVIMDAPLSPRLVPLFAPLFHGHDAVDLFIVLSGFCLMLPVVRHEGRMRQKIGHFFVRRAKRILPPYYFAVLFSLGLITLLIHQKSGTIWDTSLPVTSKSLITHLLLVQDAFGEDHTINYVFWSIAVEWRIYFLFPILVLGFRWLHPLTTTALTILISYGAYNLCHFFLGFTLSLHYLGLFSLGMLGASIVHADGAGVLSRLRNYTPWGRLSVLATFLVLSFDHNTLYHGHVPTEEQADYLVGFGSMSLLVLMSVHQTSWIRLLLSFRPLVFIGTFAYSIYLLHAPLLQVLWLAFPKQIQQQPLLMLLWLSTFGTVAILLISYTFFLFCERPFFAKRKSLDLKSTIVETVLRPAP